ncbi:MAG: hypothetical protein NTV00_12240 [Methylococcales bacterium]|nr:hypothetical protein [Methylococcales bacterium]
MKKLTMLAGVSLLVIAGSAFAAQPLNDAQMDGVSAGGATALGLSYGMFIGDNISTTSLSYGMFIGDNISTTSSTTLAAAFPIGLGLAVGQASNTTIATSLLGFAGAHSQSNAVAGIW